MSTALTILGLLMLLVFAGAALANERMKSKQLEDVKKHAVNAEIRASQETIDRLKNSNVIDIVDFLNELHKDDKGTN